MSTSFYTKVLLLLTFVIFGARAFASPSIEALATYEFLKSANDDKSVTGSILEEIRRTHATEFNGPDGVIPKPLKTSDLKVIELQHESYPGSMGPDGNWENMREPYARSKFLIAVTLVKRAYDGLLLTRQAVQFTCAVEIKPSEVNGTKVVCDQRPTPAPKFPISLSN